MMEAKVITHSDVARCPVRSLSPSHFRSDGTCDHLPDMPKSPKQEARLSRIMVVLKGELPELKLPEKRALLYRVALKLWRMT